MQVNFAGSWHSVAWWFNSYQRVNQLQFRRLQHQWHHLHGKSWHHHDWLLKPFNSWSKPFRKITQVNFWHQIQHRRFVCWVLFTIALNQDNHLDTFPGRFACPRSSTRKWLKRKHTKPFGRRLNFWEPCWMKHLSCPWRMLDYLQTGYLRPNRFSAMPLFFVMQLTSRSLRSSMTSSLAWPWRGTHLKAIFAVSTCQSSWKQTRSYGAKS